MIDDNSKIDVEKLVPAFLLKIADIKPGNEADTYVFTFEPGQAVEDPLIVPAAFYDKYSPKVGGYYIMCTNGVGLYSEE